MYVCLFHVASQYGGSVLRAAAMSGNAALYDWLVTSFGLQALTQDDSVRMGIITLKPSVRLW